MTKPKVLILRAAGTNCDIETEFAFNLAGAECRRAHINEFIYRNKSFSAYRILVIPGGFSYGDDVAAGKILANELVYRLKEEVCRFLAQDKLILGICNGFQVLARAGILPGGESPFYPLVSLVTNSSQKFEDRWVYLKIKKQNCIWTRGLTNKIIYLPVAHKEGKFIVRNKPALKEIEKNNRIVFTYCDARGKPSGYPVNPNGSLKDIAGISDSSGRILGLMPHPERYVLREQHPRWTREGAKKFGWGLSIIKNGVDYVLRH